MKQLSYQLALRRHLSIAVLIVSSALASCSSQSPALPNPARDVIGLKAGELLPPPSFLVSVSSANEILVVDPSTGEVEQTIDLVPGQHLIGGPYAMKTDPTQPLVGILATIDSTPDLVLFNTFSRQAVATIPLPVQSSVFAIAPGGDKMYVAGSQSILVVSVNRGTIIDSIPLFASASGLTVAAGKLFASFPDENAVGIINPVNHNTKLIHLGKCNLGKCRPTDLVTSPDGSVVLATGLHREGFVMDAKSEQILARFYLGNQIFAVDSFGNGAWVVDDRCCDINPHLKEVSFQSPYGVLYDSRFHYQRPISLAVGPSGSGYAIIAAKHYVLDPGPPFSSDPHGFIWLGPAINHIVYAP